MHLRLPKQIVVNGFFASYQAVAGIEATSGEKTGKLIPLRECMLQVEKNKPSDSKEDGTLTSWLATLSFLHEKLIAEVKAVAGTDSSNMLHRGITALWESTKSVAYREKDRDRFLKTIAAAKSNIARPIFEQLDAIKEVKDDDTSELATFYRQRVQDYAQVDALQREILDLKTRAVRQIGKGDIEEIRAIQRAIDAKNKDRNELIEKYVKYHDPKAAILAQEANLLEPYRKLDDFSSDHCPSYLLFNADDYFFKTIVRVDDNRKLGELTLLDYETNLTSGVRPKPVIPSPSATADIALAQRSIDERAAAVPAGAPKRGSGTAADVHKQLSAAAENQPAAAAVVAAESKRPLDQKEAEARLQELVDSGLVAQSKFKRAADQVKKGKGQPEAAAAAATAAAAPAPASPRNA